MSRSLSRQLTSLFAARKSGRRRNPSRETLRAFDALEPRTLLSNLWYVNSADTGTPDGLTPSTGFLSIQAAINTAAAGDTILVEAGNGYNESDTVGLSNLTIEADSGQSPVLDGTTPSAQSSPGFTVAAGTTGVTIEGFTIQNFSGTSAIVVQNGAALTLSADTIQDNMASGGGGGIFNSGTLTVDGGTIENNSASQGGGIFSNGTLTLNSTTIEDNSASYGGGGIANFGGILTLTNVIVMANSAPALNGGGIYDYFSSGTTAILDSTIEDNTAGYNGGGIWSQNALSITDTTIENNSATYGGGILNGGTLTDDGGTIENNSATYGGGIFDESTLTDDGGTIENNSANQGGGIYNSNTGTLTDDGGTIENNSAGEGGGISNWGTITLADTMIEQNTAAGAGCCGGGIFNTGTLTLNGTTIEDNSATDGGGIYNEAGTLTDDGGTILNNSADDGGGIFNQGTITLAGTTIENNSASQSGGGISNGGTLTDNGSTIENNTASSGIGGGIVSNGTLTLNGTTIEDNSAGGGGGGITNFGGILTLTNVIVMGNSASQNGGGGIVNYFSYGTTTILDSTIANNSAGYGGGIFSQNAHFDHRHHDRK